MNISEFLNLLEANPEAELRFEYAHGKQVRADYHITEVKNVHIEATDCGGRQDSWRETVIQLWEPEQAEETRRSLSTRKALAILGRVGAVQPLLKERPLKFEYGNPDFHTSQLPVMGYEIQPDRVLLKLGIDTTQCKAQELCGPAASSPQAVKEEVAASSCAPGSGCC